MTSWMCQSADHEGERIVRRVEDRFVKRITYYRADGMQRMHERVVEHPNRCKACVMREASGVNPNQAALWG